MTSRLRGALAVAILALSACGKDTGTGPGGPDSTGDTLTVRRIAVGDTVDESMAANDSLRRFSLVATGADLVVFIQADAGGFDLRVSDSASGALATDRSASAAAEEGRLFALHTATFAPPPGTILLIRVYAYQRVASRLRFIVLPIEAAPEHAAADLVIGDTVTTEQFDGGADVDQFRLQAAAGDELIAYVRNLSDSLTETVSLAVTQVGDTTSIGHAISQEGDSDLEYQSTGRMVMPATGTYQVALSQSGKAPPGPPPPGAGRYEFQVRRINRAPERVPAELQPGDTLSAESLDYAGDIDEFEVPVVQGGRYAVFVQSGPGRSAAYVTVHVTGLGMPEQGVASDPQDTLLSGQTTGPFVAAATGSLLVRVESGENGSPLERFAYRLFVYPVNPAPEHAPAALTAGQSADEVLDFPGDMDVFTVPAPSTGMLHFGLSGLSSDVAFSQLGLADTVLEPCFAAVGACGFTDRRATAPLTVAVWTNPDATAGFPRPYRLTATAIDTMPEGTSPVFAVGDTVHGALDVAGDIDTYQFTYTAGQWIRLASEGGGGTTSNSFVYFVRNGSGFLQQADPHGGPFTLPGGGTYSLVVRGAGSGATLTETGPYWFALLPAGTAPESVAGTLTDGVPVTGESVDFQGDIDEFVFHGTPGAEAEVLLTTQLQLQIDAVPATSDVVLAHEAGRASGRVLIPGDGMLRFRIYQGSQALGPYTIVAHQIDRAPEVASPALILGSAVTTEAIDLIGDVDEFTFAGTAGQPVSITLSFPQAFDLSRGVAELVDPSSQVVLGSVTGHDATLDSSGPIVLPATRTYIVRVRGEQDTKGQGGYRLLVQ